jgi:Rrf2 family transcriptional regulator, nitric oxide-sensitive transcriptional repressor
LGLGHFGICHAERTTHRACILYPVFSQTTEYALRTVVFLATFRGEPATTRQIAAATRTPEGYLSKILQSLSRAGLVKSQRGPHGGSVLGKDAADITVYDVVTAIAPLPRIVTCPLGLKSHGTTLCTLHRRLDDAVAMVERAFRASTIADMLAEATPSIPLVDLPGDDSAADRAAEAAFPVAAGERVTLRVRKPRKGAKSS